MLLAQENVQLHLHFKQPATDLKKIGVGIAQVQSFSIKKSKSFEVFTDTQTSMLFGIPKSAICVQRFDDSLNSAIHITFRTFAAFFIDAKAKRSVVESCILNCLFIIFFRQRVKK